MLFHEAVSPTRPYRVLARAYRPCHFEEMIGQDLLVASLSQALKQGRLPHAFIFTGIRGVGKTTTARILARCLNCEQGITLRPCGACESCRAIQEDRHLDVIEMDAASHTGVDDIRDLIESGRYRAVMGRYKVFIIDEAHMLSRSAFNALLKTLEEPPPHLVFILATTEIEKVPSTVLSRCMRCELKRVGTEVLTQHILKIATQENTPMEAVAAEIIARAVEGSVRDAMSLLDQAITLSSGGVTQETVRDMLGLMDKDRLIQLMQSLCIGNVAQVLQHTQDCHRDGASALKVAESLLELVYVLTMIKTEKTAATEMPAYFSGRKEALQDLAMQVSLDALMKAWNHLLMGVTEIQMAPEPHQALDMVLVRLMYSVQGSVSTSLSVPQGTQASDLVYPLIGKTTQEEVTLEPQPLTAMPHSLGTLQDIVHILAQHKEVLLAQEVRRDVCPVRVAPQHLTLAFEPGAAPDLARRLKDVLTRVTQCSWQVDVHATGGRPTLEAQEKLRSHEEKEQLMKHPLLAAAIDAFPDAVVTIDPESRPEERGGM